MILDGSIAWSPAALGQALLAYVGNGGRLVSIGQSSLLRTAPITKGAAGLERGTAAAPPRHRPVRCAARRNRRHPGELITVISDPLGIFSTTSGAFSGFDAYQVIAPPGHATASMAGSPRRSPASAASGSAAGWSSRSGSTDSRSSLAHNTDSQELLARLWQLLSG